MDSQTKSTVHIELGDSREVERHSPRMEKVLVERGLNFLVHKSPLLIWEVTSDASRTIIALMIMKTIYFNLRPIKNINYRYFKILFSIFKENDPFKHLQHSLDICSWHRAKKLASSLADVAKKSQFRELLP